MMKNLGEKLQEARNAMGLSLRDVADATRLRADVIENMESGKFDFPLPEIYKRGFLRIYAAFLKLDVAETMAELTVMTQAHGDPKKARHLLSRMAAQPREDAAERHAAVEEPVAAAQSRFEDAAEEEAQKTSDEDPMRNLKLGAIFVALVLAVVVIILIVSNAVRSEAPAENPDLAISAQIPTQPADASSTAPAGTVAPKGEIVLVVTAIGDTYLLAYPENDPTKPLFSGPLQVGERKEFKSSVPIMVKLTDADRVKLERNSKVLDLKGAKGLRLFKVGYSK